MKRIGTKIFIMICCLFLMISSDPIDPIRRVQAESVQKMANLVIFVKMKGDNRDIFNAVYKTATYERYNWQEIRKMYDGGNGTAKDNSFSHYINVISEGKVEVINLFPQEYFDPTDNQMKVKTFELSKDYYEQDYAMITEVIEAINQGVIPVDPSAVKLDNMSAGLLDNLTIIVQGDNINGQTHAYKSNYNGTETFGSAGLRVQNYNAFPSSFLVTEDGSIGVAQMQGALAHEFLHVLGFPDLYRNNGIGNPVGMWDVMGGITCFLQYPLGYLRYKQGWISASEITQNGTYTLTDVQESGGNKLFMIKTPLSESDSQIICLEYRKLSDDLNDFEHIIGYEGGLLMYRVDTSVMNQTNIAGENYIYVYRPDVSDPKSGADVDKNGINLINKAALNVANGETSYGSTDLSKTFQENTLYYSDGQNSGVSIENCRLSDDGKSLTFDVKFADYQKSEFWDPLGGNAGESVTMDEPFLYADDENLYIAYQQENKQVVVKKWNEQTSSWNMVGTSFSTNSTWPAPKLISFNGELIAVVLSGAAANPVYRKFNGKSWSNPVKLSDASYPMSLQLIKDETDVYAVYQQESGSKKKLVIQNVLNGSIVNESLQAADFSNPSVVKKGSVFYVAYTDFGKGKAKVSAFDLAVGKWETLHEFSYSANVHSLIVKDNKIIALVGGTNQSPILAIYENGKWTEKTIPYMKQYTSVSVDAIEDRVYITYMDGTSNQIKMIVQKDGNFEMFDENLGTSMLYFDTCSISNAIYLATKAMNSTNIVVRKKTMPQSDNPLLLKLPIPSGYTDSSIWIDGVEYIATRTGNELQILLPDTKGKSAVMYQVNDKNIPIGMSAWKLTYPNGKVQAKLLSGLTDLISYHGFSIRVQSPAGIRFKSGISSSLRSKLLSSTVDGYKLVEYGTLFITQANRSKVPFVKNGEKVGGGRSYWKENGVITDKIFETVSGRIRFTSVLINLSSDMYATEIAFRAYVILEDQDGQIIIYGPPVSRSVYTVAKQVLSGNEFKVGSSGYNYVKSIVDQVEKK